MNTVERMKVSVEMRKKQQTHAIATWNIYEGIDMCWNGADKMLSSYLRFLKERYERIEC